MQQTIPQEEIRLKRYLNEQDITDIHLLQDICYAYDHVNLKLELEYRRELEKVNSGLEHIDEFLYYADGKLVSYLSISCFGGRIGEITGMTHPDWRRRGIFTRLFRLAKAEAEIRNYRKLLLLADHQSESGAAFIRSIEANYDFSEYHMTLPKIEAGSGKSPVSLRKSEPKDRKEIRRQDIIYFEDDVEEADEDTGSFGSISDPTYMVELDGKTVGKIRIEFYEVSAYLLGFGILPEYRGRGLGRAALREALCLLTDQGIKKAELDVVATNANALNLYKSVGFMEDSVMDYYCIESSKLD